MMRPRGGSPRMLFLCASLAAFGAVNCTDDKPQPLPLAPVEPVAFGVHVSYCKDGAPGLDVPGTRVQLVQGSTTLEATTDEHGMADFGEITPGVYDLTVSRETAYEDPQALGGGDVNALIQFLEARRAPSTCGLEAADVSQDGSITIDDLQALRSFLSLRLADGGYTAQWRSVDAPPHVDLRDATTLEIHAMVLGDTDLSWPIRY